MTAATRKASERQRRKERGEVALSGWLSASEHAALTQMARDAEMTQAQVVGRLIGMPAKVIEARNLIGARLDNMSTLDRECAINKAWHDLTAAVALRCRRIAA